VISVLLTLWKCCLLSLQFLEIVIFLHHVCFSLPCYNHYSPNLSSFALQSGIQISAAVLRALPMQVVAHLMNFISKAVILDLPLVLLSRFYCCKVAFDELTGKNFSYFIFLTSEVQIHVTLFIRAFDIRGFISVLRGTLVSYPRPNFKPVPFVELFPGLSGNVMQMISLASKNSGASLTSKWRLLYLSRFTRFFYTQRLAGTQPPCTTRVTCR
jgi:hypothetical protein